MLIVRPETHRTRFARDRRGNQPATALSPIPYEPARARVHVGDLAYGDVAMYK